MTEEDRLWRLALAWLRDRPRDPFYMSDEFIVMTGVDMKSFAAMATPDLEVFYEPQYLRTGVRLKNLSPTL